MVKAIVGLGNPGRKYRNNRHNLGFVVVDYLCEKSGGSFKKKDKLYEFTGIEIDHRQVHLLKPLMYMNLSGESVKSYCEEYRIEPEETIIISDDADLPLGKIRLRASGSDGGHIGLRSIITSQKSENFPRLRIGIGLPPSGLPLEEYVLRDFTKEEVPLAKAMVLRAYEAILTVVKSGLEEAMNIYNRDAEGTEAES